MKVEIDQSGKIENTNRPTVIGFSNSETGSLILPAKEKKLLNNYFKKCGRPRLFIFLVFSAQIVDIVKI